MTRTITTVIDLIPGEILPLATIQAESLTEQAFWDQYVRKTTPVLIKGAAAAWPAIQSWKHPSYLQGRCGDIMVEVSHTFNASPQLETAAQQRQRLQECIAEMCSAADDITISAPAIDIPESWQADIGEFRFLRARNRNPLGYPRRRIFLYKNASTEWHYHPLDETLTTQLVGSKRVSLFRLTRSSWFKFAPLIKANFHHMPCGQSFFPSDIRLQKFQGDLDAGDALYIPPFWWHGIDAANAVPGITLAHCFRSPLSRFGNWNDPVTRELLSDALRFNKLRFVPLLILILLSSLSRKVKRESWIIDS
jgi:hypothetical protein